MLFCFPTERDTETKEVRYVTDTMCRLEGHSNRITGLSWSFHREAQIVSASYDGSAQVCSVFVTILKSTYFNSLTCKYISVTLSPFQSTGLGR